MALISTGRMPLPPLPDVLHIEMDMRKIRRFLFVVIGLLFLANIPAAVVASEADRFYFDHPQARLFLLDSERNIPTMWSCLQLAACGLIAFIHGFLSRRTGHRDGWRWLFIAGTFGFLTLDEGIQIHEYFDDFAVEELAVSGAIISDWVFIGLPLALLIAAPFVPWVLRLPPRVRNAFFGGAGLFLLGAVGIEYAADRLVAQTGFGTPLYPVLSSSEELLELVGVAIVLTALLSHLQERLDGQSVQVSHVGGVAPTR